MKKFRSVCSLALAAGLCLTSAAMTAKAADMGITAELVSDGTNVYQILYGDIEPEGTGVLTKITFDIDGDFSSAGWIGGGGATGLNYGEEEWYQVDYTIVDDHNEITLEIPAEIASEIDFSNSEQIIQIGFWWGSVNNATLSNVNLVFEGAEAVDETETVDDAEPAEESEAALPQTGVVSTVVFFAAGAALTAAGAAVKGKKED